MTTIINLFGGPGAGKSSTASGLFHEMKRRGHSVELVAEYAKAMVWEKRDNILADQLYILAKQNRAVARVAGQVDWAINEAPVINGLVYVPDGYHASFPSLVREIWDSYDNLNFLVLRRHEYKTEGRYQDEAGADAVARKVAEFLRDEGIPFVAAHADEAVGAIMAHVSSRAADPRP